MLAQELFTQEQNQHRTQTLEVFFSASGLFLAMLVGLILGDSKIAKPGPGTAVEISEISSGSEL